MENDLISRKQAIESIKPIRCYSGDFISTLIHLPAVNARPIVRAHWILSCYQNEEDTCNNDYNYECSNCSASDVHRKGFHVPYCWYCGAEMEDNNE